MFRQIFLRQVIPLIDSPAYDSFYDVHFEMLAAQLDFAQNDPSPQYWQSATAQFVKYMFRNAASWSEDNDKIRATIFFKLYVDGLLEYSQHVLFISKLFDHLQRS